MIDNNIQSKYTVCMLRFEWDTAKAKTNVSKHGISFEEAKSVFYDDAAIEFYDDEHSDWEDRFLMLGFSAKRRILLICHCYRENDHVIRIISARKATKQEASNYHR